MSEEVVQCGCHTYMKLTEKDVKIGEKIYDRYTCPGCGAEEFILHG